MKAENKSNMHLRTPIWPELGGLLGETKVKISAKGKIAFIENLFNKEL